MWRYLGTPEGAYSCARLWWEEDAGGETEKSVIDAQGTTFGERTNSGQAVASQVHC